MTKIKMHYSITFNNIPIEDDGNIIECYAIMPQVQFSTVKRVNMVITIKMKTHEFLPTFCFIFGYINNMRIRMV